KLNSRAYTLTIQTHTLPHFLPTSISFFFNFFFTIGFHLDFRVICIKISFIPHTHTHTHTLPALSNRRVLFTHSFRKSFLTSLRSFAQIRFTRHRIHNQFGGSFCVNFN
ncbi:GSCOCG00010298001-RA-CDS, partial [Cotesia congregata]